MTEEKITKNEPLVRQKNIKKKKGKIICEEGNNAEKRTLTEIRALFRVVDYKAEKLSLLSATTWDIFLRCGQQCGKMFSVEGNNEEELPQRRTVKHFLRASLFL